MTPAPMAGLGSRRSAMRTFLVSLCGPCRDWRNVFRVSWGCSRTDVVRSEGDRPEARALFTRLRVFKARDSVPRRLPPGANLVGRSRSWASGARSAEWERARRGYGCVRMPTWRACTRCISRQAPKGRGLLLDRRNRAGASRRTLCLYACHRSLPVL